MSVSLSFQSHQIVYLEYDDEKLYAEVIQVVPERELCWARPLALLKAAQVTPFSDAIVNKNADTTWDLRDLRQASDILLPISFFQLALDVEVLPLLGKFYSDEEQPDCHRSPLEENDRFAQQQLIQFFRKICEAHPERFQLSHQNRK